jgi:hypothetical protein
MLATAAAMAPSIAIYVTDLEFENGAYPINTGPARAAAAINGHKSELNSRNCSPKITGKK